MKKIMKTTFCLLLVMWFVNLANAQKIPTGLAEQILKDDNEVDTLHLNRSGYR